MQQLAERAPALEPLDTTARNYAVAMADWAAILQKADKYYAGEDYKVIAMAMGKAMHADIVAKYQAFDAASDALSDALVLEEESGFVSHLHRAQASVRGAASGCSASFPVAGGARQSSV